MRVLLATDGSLQSLKAADWVWRLHNLYPDLHVIVLCVVPRPGLWRDGEYLEESLERWAQAAVEQTVNQLELPPEQVTRTILAGVPADVICRHAREERCDLIAMGATGAGLLVEILLGSTTHRVLELAPVPVLVTR